MCSFTLNVFTYESKNQNPRSTPKPLRRDPYTCVECVLLPYSESSHPNPQTKRSHHIRILGIQRPVKLQSAARQSLELACLPPGVSKGKIGTLLLASKCRFLFLDYVLYIYISMYIYIYIYIYIFSLTPIKPGTPVNGGNGIMVYDAVSGNSHVAVALARDSCTRRRRGVEGLLRATPIASPSHVDGTARLRRAPALG